MSQVERSISHTAGMLLAISIALSAIAAAQPASPSNPGFDPYKREFKIPMAEAGTDGLQTWLFTPSKTGKFPLVLMMPSRYDKLDRKIGPGELQPAARWFVRRGWAVAIVMGRGSGASGGQRVQWIANCGQPGLESVAEPDALDFRAAYDFLTVQTGIDASRVIAVGDRNAGVAVVTFAVKPPPALKAVISLAAPWPSEVLHPWACKHHLPGSFSPQGNDPQIPTLWIYARNDHWDKPKEINYVHDAWVAAGREAELSIVDKSDTDGTLLFTQAPALWGPVVEQFLTGHGLPAVALYPEIPVPQLQPPPGLGSDGLKAFAKFLTLGPYKAFAIGPNGGWASVSGRVSKKVAEQEAVNHCGPSICRVYASDPQ
jgi:dienelactone hydrolase